MKTRCTFSVLRGMPGVHELDEERPHQAWAVPRRCSNFKAFWRTRTQQLPGKCKSTSDVSIVFLDDFLMTIAVYLMMMMMMMMMMTMMTLTTWR